MICLTIVLSSSVLKPLVSFLSGLNGLLLLYINDNDLFPSLQSVDRQFLDWNCNSKGSNWWTYLQLYRRQLYLLSMLNLSAAFDTVDHAILYRRLKSVLAKRYGLECFSSHLTGRSQQVSVNNVMAMYVSPDYGLPQGSVLSPVMYLLYTTSDRVELVRWFCLLTHA